MAGKSKMEALKEVQASEVARILAMQQTLTTQSREIVILQKKITEICDQRNDIKQKEALAFEADGIRRVIRWMQVTDHTSIIDCMVWCLQRERELRGEEEWSPHDF